MIISSKKIKNDPSIIAYFVVLAIFFTSLIKPAYASTVDSAFSNSTSFEQVYGVKINSEALEKLKDELIDESKYIILGIIEGAVICYTIDGVATTVFPPAAALLPYCPAIGAFSGGAMVEIKEVIIH